MKKFKFNLAALLRIRKRLEERMRQEFSDQKRRVDTQQNRLNQLVRDRENADRQLRLNKVEQVSMALMRSMDEYLQHVQKSVHQAEAELELLKDELKKRREAMIKAQQDVTVLEKIKETRLQDYQKELSKQEQAFLDEMAISKQSKAKRR